MEFLHYNAASIGIFAKGFAFQIEFESFFGTNYPQFSYSVFCVGTASKKKLVFCRLLLRSSSNVFVHDLRKSVNSFLAILVRIWLNLNLGVQKQSILRFFGNLHKPFQDKRVVTTMSKLHRFELFAGKEEVRH